MVRGGVALLALGFCASAGAQVVPGYSQEALATGTDPEELRFSLQDFAAAAKELDPALIDALHAAGEREVVVREAAPELRSALHAVAEGHPDAATRARAAEQVTALTTTARTMELRRLALELKQQGTPGVELWTTLAKRAVELNQAEGKSNQEVIDAVVLDVGSVINGEPLGENLGTYRNTLGRLPGNDPLLEELLGDLEGYDLKLTSVGMHLEQSAETDFRADLYDGTDNQVFHSGFFVALGYAVGDKDPDLPHLVNLKHETLDDVSGRSVEDYRASAVAIETGRRLRELREADGDPRQIPVILGAAFAADPAPYRQAWGPASEDWGELVDAVRAQSEATSKNPRGDSRFGRASSRVQERLIRTSRRAGEALGEATDKAGEAAQKTYDGVLQGLEKIRPGN